MKWKLTFAILVATAACFTLARDALAAAVCTLTSLTPCVFASYTGAQVDATGSILYNCTTGGIVTIEYTAGSSGTINDRTFSTGSPVFHYQVYTDAARTNVWPLILGGAPAAIVPTGNNTKIYYCRLPAGQSPSAGAYNDTAVFNMWYTSTIWATASSPKPVSATVTTSCSISVSAALAFGTYDPIVANLATNLDQTASVSVNCTNGTAYKITAGQGLTPAGGSSVSVPLRQMASGANRLAYFLYQNVGRTTVLGDTSGTGIAGTGSGGAQSVSVYGRIPAAQNKPFGASYVDTVLMTVTW